MLIHTTKAQGGDLGWVNLKLILPQIAIVVVNLTKGEVSEVPIRSNLVWHLVKVDDKRPFKIPTFEESKNQL